jgi:hypothetical protein
VALPKGAPYTIEASTDLQHWTAIANGVSAVESFDYLDSEAFKFSYRYYRVATEAAMSVNVLGYASVTLPPGFSMIANPLDGASNTVADLFADWPDGTTFSKFDPRMFRLCENAVKGGKWLNPTERLVPGEGAIFFNPTSEYKLLSFAGDVLQGQLSMPIPSGFSVRSPQVPQPGSLDDLSFPISDGDVIHLFDRDRQMYVLHPYEGGRWTSGTPLLSVGEAFWVAKTVAGNWTTTVAIPD